jgi:hypothetical protein
MTALAVVLVTATTFVVRAWPHRRKFSFAHDTHCGCGSSSAANKNSIVFHARKGERAQVIMKMK